MMVRVVIITCILMGVVFLLFSETINYDFLNWDDDVYVTNNDRVKSGDDPGWWFRHFYYYSYIPVTMLSHQADYALFGGMPRGHHLTNVLLHSFNAGWLFLAGVVLVRIRRKIDTGVLTGIAAGVLLFALHPLRAESVAWVSDRKDLLSFFFLLPAILFYVAYRQRGDARSPAFLVVAFLLFLLAVLAKSTVIGFPLVLLVIDWYLIPAEQWNRDRLRLVLEKWPFFLVSAALVITLLLIPSGGKQAYAVEQLQGSEFIFFPFYSMMFYFYKTLLPVGLSPIYPSVSLGQMIVAVLLFLTLTGGVVFSATRGRKEFPACWIIYLILIVPTVVGLSSGMQAQADRFSYLSTMPFYLLAGGGIVTLIARGSGLGRVLAVTAAAVSVMALASMTIRHVPIWQSSEDLWGYIYDSFPPSRDYSDAYVNLGSDLAYQMKLPEAEEVLQTAIAVDSTNVAAFYNLAHVLYLRGEWEQAAGLFLRTTLLDSTYAEGYFNYAIVTSQLGRDEDAIPAMKRAARLGMESAQAALRGIGLQEENNVATSPVE